MSGAAPVWRIWIDRPPPPDVAIPDDVEMVDDLTAADGAIVGADNPWNGAVCRRLPLLKVVARSGIGYDNVDVASCAAEGVAACNTPDAPTVSTAEHSLAMLLAVAKNIKSAARRLRQGGGEYRSKHAAVELEGLTLGLLGCGRIGSRLGGYADALGMRVIACDPHVSQASVADFVELVSLGALWRRSHAVSLHAPATSDTLRIVDAAAIAQMRVGVIIVNCARGGLIDHEALLAGLRSGHVAGAGLDVTDPEPLPPDHPLLHRDAVIVTPHVASATAVGTRRLISQALEQAVVWLRGGTPDNLLDTAAADPAVDRRFRRLSSSGAGDPVVAAAPAVDRGSRRYPSSGAGGPVVAVDRRVVVTPTTGDRDG